MDRDEILLGRPWTNEDEGKVYFRIKDLEAHLKRNNFSGLSAPKMAQRMREMGGDPVNLYLKGRSTRVWTLPRFDKQDSPFVTPEMKKVSPF
jgi:hypothetical protein